MEGAQHRHHRRRGPRRQRHQPDAASTSAARATTPSASWPRARSTGRSASPPKAATPRSPGASFAAQPLALFTGHRGQRQRGRGRPTRASPRPITGQTIVLQGQGFTSSTLVQFQGVDDSGRLGTLTRTGTAGARRHHAQRGGAGAGAQRLRQRAGQRHELRVAGRAHAARRWAAAWPRATRSCSKAAG